MKTIMLTGATGAMGKDALAVFTEKNEFKLRVLMHPTPRSKKVMAHYRNNKNITIIDGDIRNYDDVKKAIDGADFIVNLGAMVSPRAEYVGKELTMGTNVESIQNIIKAVKESGREDQIKVISIGSVAMIGNRSFEKRWSRVGEPMNPSKFDWYGVSKVVGERMLWESGLKYWVNLRQNGVLHDGLLLKMQAHMFHVPYDCCLEWATAYDSAILLRNICRDDKTPETFWQNAYVIGGGEKCRLVQHEAMESMFGALGMKKYKDATNLNWYATRNFHGYFSADSHELNDMFDYQHTGAKEFFISTAKKLPFYFKFAGMLPYFMIKNLIMKPVCFNDVQGPMYWVKKEADEYVEAFWGSYDKVSKLPKTWYDVELPNCGKKDSDAVLTVELGYDTKKDLKTFTTTDLQKAAEFRGGKLLSTSYSGNPMELLEWQCSCGDAFKGSVKALLRGGHWCPSCDTTWDKQENLAKNSKFYAQVFDRT